MWFKNAIFYTLSDTFELEEATLNQKLQEHAFSPCSASNPETAGFSSPLEVDPEQMVHSDGQYWLISLKCEKKLLPASVVNQQLAAKCQEIEDQTGHKPSKTQKLEIKEELEHTLRGQAFATASYIQAYFDWEHRLLVVNTASATKADFFTASLRQAIGSLPIETVEAPAIANRFTTWLANNDYPDIFVIGEECTFLDPSCDASIRCQKENIIGEDITALIGENRQCIQMSFSYLEQMSFVLSQELYIKKIKYLTMLQDQAKDIYCESVAEKKAANFHIMSRSISELIQALIDTFCGTQAEETTPAQEAVPADA